MRFVLYTDHYSPHELPLFLACCEVFDDAVYIVNRAWPQEASRKGWGPDFKGRRTIVLQDVDPAERSTVFADLLTSDTVLMYGSYDNPYNKLISKSKGIVIYASERWLKPLCVRVPLLNITLKISGMAHLLSLKFVRRMISIATRLNREKRFFYFPLGVYAATDMARICRLLSGNLRFLFRAPELDFERKPGGEIWLKDGGDGKRYCLDKMRMWGYYVEHSKFDALPVQEASEAKSREIKVLWVGRLLNLKRVDTIVRAVGEHANLKRVDNSLPTMTLDIYGEGPEEYRLKCVAAKYGNAIRFRPFVAMEEIRGLMRAHDVYILSSNEYEGWGAVVSEALEEGMCVLCSREAGAGATILPDECLFPCGDVDGLARKLQNLPTYRTIGPWTAKNAANAALEFAVNFTKEEY